MIGSTPDAVLGPGFHQPRAQQTFRQADEVCPAHGVKLRPGDIRDMFTERVRGPGIEIGADRLAGQTAIGR